MFSGFSVALTFSAPGMDTMSVPLIKEGCVYISCQDSQKAQQIVAVYYHWQAFVVVQASDLATVDFSKTTSEAVSGVVVFIGQNDTDKTAIAKQIDGVTKSFCLRHLRKPPIHIVECIQKSSDSVIRKMETSGYYTRRSM